MKKILPFIYPILVFTFIAIGLVTSLNKYSSISQESHRQANIQISRFQDDFPSLMNSTPTVSKDDVINYFRNFIIQELGIVDGIIIYEPKEKLVHFKASEFEVDYAKNYFNSINSNDVEAGYNLSPYRFAAFSTAATMNDGNMYQIDFIYPLIKQSEIIDILQSLLVQILILFGMGVILLFVARLRENNPETFSGIGKSMPGQLGVPPVDLGEGFFGDDDDDFDFGDDDDDFSFSNDEEEVESSSPVAPSYNEDNFSNDFDDGNISEDFDLGGDEEFDFADGQGDSLDLDDLGSDDLDLTGDGDSLDLDDLGSDELDLGGDDLDLTGDGDNLDLDDLGSDDLDLGGDDLDLGDLDGEDIEEAENAEDDLNFDDLDLDLDEENEGKVDGGEEEITAEEEIDFPLDEEEEPQFNPSVEGFLDGERELKGAIDEALSEEAELAYIRLQDSEAPLLEFAQFIKESFPLNQIYEREEGTFSILLPNTDSETAEDQLRTVVGEWQTSHNSTTVRGGVTSRNNRNVDADYLEEEIRVAMERGSPAEPIVSFRSNNEQFEDLTA